MDENGTRQRRPNDQEGQKRDIKIDLEQPSYGGKTGNTKTTRYMYL